MYKPQVTLGKPPRGWNLQCHCLSLSPLFLPVPAIISPLICVICLFNFSSVKARETPTSHPPHNNYSFMRLLRPLRCAINTTQHHITHRRNFPLSYADNSLTLDNSPYLLNTNLKTIPTVSFNHSLYLSSSCSSHGDDASEEEKMVPPANIITHLIISPLHSLYPHFLPLFLATISTVRSNPHSIVRRIQAANIFNFDKHNTQNCVLNIRISR